MGGTKLILFKQISKMLAEHHQIIEIIENMSKNLWEMN
jgi:hypothetical protein